MFDKNKSATLKLVNIYYLKAMVSKYKNICTIVEIDIKIVTKVNTRFLSMKINIIHKDIRIVKLYEKAVQYL